MKPHAFGIKEAEAAIAAAESLDGNAPPIVLLIPLAIRLAGALVRVIDKKRVNEIVMTLVSLDLVLEDGLPPVTAIHDVVDRSGILNA